MAARGSEQFRVGLDSLLRVIARELVRQHRQRTSGQDPLETRTASADTEPRQGSTVAPARSPAAGTGQEKCPR